jgi:phage/plasmid-like protein (TIGR03299 family)
MAHLIENMLYVGKVPWHGLGTPLDHPPTVQDAIRLAGLDWPVQLAPLHLADGRTVPAFATVRATDQRVLGVVGPQYRPLQNLEAFDWFQPFLDLGEASIHTAGSLAGGKRVWVLAKLNRAPITITADDTVEKFLLLSNSHDGTLAVRVGFTPIRVVCANTLAMAHGAEASRLLRVRHTKGTLRSLEAIRDVMDLANQSFEATAEQYRRLATRDICPADLRRYVKQVFSLPEERATERPQQRRLLESCVRLFEVGQGNALITVRGTAWAAYNAVTEYLGTERGRTAESRLNSLWFGDSARLSERALELATTLAS